MIKEADLPVNKGRIKGNKIAIRRNLTSILDQTIPNNQKQELHARLWAYNELIGLRGIVQAYENGCTSLHETAEYLEVTEDFLSETLQIYKSKYEDGVIYGKYKISFNPILEVKRNEG